MSELRQVLERNGIDSASLELVLDRDGEQIFGIMVPQEEAIATWETLRRLVDETGFWPVVGWGRRWLDGSAEYADKLQRGSTSDLIAAILQLDAGQWLHNRADEEPELFEDIHGEWPEASAPSHGYASLEYSHTAEASPKVPIALVPTTQGWQVPAYLRFDTWDCPPEVHAAVLRQWGERYGAELVALLPDLIEMHIRRPPDTASEALQLANEQYIYCNDTVVQGTQTIEALAATLLGGTTWFFWWD